MGYALLVEDMLPSVLFARDKFLRKDGQLFIYSLVSDHLDLI